MRKLFTKKFVSMLICSSLMVGTATAFTGCSGGGSSNEDVTLDVYSQLANYSGMQQGWSADILQKELGIKIKIIPNQDGIFQTRMENGNLGDVVVFGKDSEDYVTAVKGGALFDWNEDDLLTDFGPYIKENMSYALKKNQELTKTITGGASDTLYGFGQNVALSAEDHESFFYTWDVRWDLYKQLGYPKVNNLEDFRKMLKDMQGICPTDDTGNKVYAVSLWPDWDDAMVMYVKASATAYYGYDELAIGLYDPVTGNYHDALEENGPYLELLRFYNKLYQDGLVDPDSMTQTYDKMIEKVQNGGVLFSIFNYSGSLAYNTDNHTSAGKIMRCMKPEDASPIVYGMNPQGGDRPWTIGAKSEYPEKAMELINYLATPTGWMNMNYGPKGYTWDYDDNGKTYLTEQGLKCQTDKKTPMGGDYKGTYHDGELQINNTTWSMDAQNPESNGETYNKDNWESTNLVAGSEIEEDWRKQTNSTSVNDYMNQRKFTVSPGSSYAKSKMEPDFQTTYTQVTDCIKKESWNAVYAKSDKEFDKIVANMKKSAKSYGYDKCVEWSKNEAARRKQLEDQIKQK